MLAGIAFLYDSIGRGVLPRVPAFVWIGAGVILAVSALHALFPTTDSYLGKRLVEIPFDFRSQEQGAGERAAGIEWLVATLVLPAITIAASKNRGNSVALIALSWVLGAAVSAVVAIADSAGVTSVGSALLGFADYGGRESGLATHSNNLGVACALATPIAIYLLRRGFRTSLAVVLLLGTGVVLSGSRGSQIAFLLAIVLTFALHSHSRRAAFCVLASGGIISGLVTALLPDLERTFFRFGATSSSTSLLSNYARERVADQALLDFAHNPFFGIGLSHLTEAHSIYLQVLASGGLLLLFGVSAYFAGSLKALWRIRKASPLAGYLFVTLLVWLLVGIIENQLTDRYLYYPIGLGAALLVQEVNFRPATPVSASALSN